MLVNILGGDGGGKTTQIARLTRWVADEFDLPSRTMAKRDIFDPLRFPECDFFGVPYEHVAHRSLPLMRDEARALWLIYMNAVLMQRSPPKPHEVVFHDGYWHKHYATEAALGLDPEWLLGVCKFFPEPDLTVLLDIDPREIVRRGHKHKPYESGCDFSCSDESFVSHQDKVRSFLLLMAQDRGYAIVEAARPEDEVFDQLRTLLRTHLEGHRLLMGALGSSSPTTAARVRSA